jgi:hypothetical protein
MLSSLPDAHLAQPLAHTYAEADEMQLAEQLVELQADAKSSTPAEQQQVLQLAQQNRSRRS